MAAAAAPAGLPRRPPAPGESRPSAPSTIFPVAEANIFNTPQVSACRSCTPASSPPAGSWTGPAAAGLLQVGAAKVYGFSQVEQLNASMVSSTCRLGFIGGAFGDATIQAGSIVAPDVPFFPPIPLIRNPAPNTVIILGSLTVTLNKQTVTGGRLTVTGIYITGLGQTLSIAVSRCSAPTVGRPFERVIVYTLITRCMAAVTRYRVTAARGAGHAGALACRTLLVSANHPLRLMTLGYGSTTESKSRRVRPAPYVLRGTADESDDPWRGRAGRAAGPGGRALLAGDARHRPQPARRTTSPTRSTRSGTSARRRSARPPIRAARR